MPCLFAAGKTGDVGNGETETEIEMMLSALILAELRAGRVTESAILDSLIMHERERVLVEIRRMVFRGEIKRIKRGTYGLGSTRKV